MEENKAKEIKTDAQELNRLGENLLKAGRVDDAYDYFCQAQKYRVFEHGEAALAGYPVLYKAKMIERTDRVWYTDDKSGPKQENVWRINHVYLPRKYHCQFFGTKRKTV